jgi:hypothetical protein
MFSISMRTTTPGADRLWKKKIEYSLHIGVKSTGWLAQANQFTT